MSHCHTINHCYGTPAIVLYVLRPRPGLGQASVSFGAPRMPTNLLHQPLKQAQKSGQNMAAIKRLDSTCAWSRGAKRNLVFEAEILPYNLALHCWSDLMRGKHILVYIDNDGSRQSWIKCTADLFFARSMIHQGTLMEAALDATPYLCRAPTSSNLADGPSRLDEQLRRTYLMIFCANAR